jgi:site-specific recombinase XerD
MGSNSSRRRRSLVAGPKLVPNPGKSVSGDVDLGAREIRVRGKGGRDRIVRIGHEAARRLDRYLRGRAGHELAYRPELWLGVNGRGVGVRE